MGGGGWSGSGEGWCHELKHGGGVNALEGGGSIQQKH